MKRTVTLCLEAESRHFEHYPSFCKDTIGAPDVWLFCTMFEKLACFDICPRLSEFKTVFNIFGSKIKEWWVWDEDQLLEDPVQPLILI
jgi:hypothetical protein